MNIAVYTTYFVLKRDQNIYSANVWRVYRGNQIMVYATHLTTHLRDRAGYEVDC